MKKIFPYGMIILGGLILPAGFVFAAMYVLEALLNRLGDPDQSLLFWYLPILFIGVFGMAAGLGLIIGGVKRLKANRFVTGQQSRMTDK